MNLPSFKDIFKVLLEKLSVFKNNLSLLIPVIIVLVSLFFFIATQLMSSSLRKKILQKSIRKGAEILEELEEKVVSDEQLEIETKILEAIETDANEIILLAKQTTQRQLLSYDIFNLDPCDPNITFSQSVFFEFGQEYCDGIDEFIAVNNARDCPTETERQNELDASEIVDNLQSVSGSVMDLDVGSEQEEVEGLLIDQICQKRAESSFIYIDPWQISGYEFWGQYDFSSLEEDIENCWYSQLGYWIIEDILDTIIALNTGYENLTIAPVKRLMKIIFADETLSLSSGTSDNKASEYSDRPQYVLSSVDIPKETLSGRYCNENYDVVHFKATFVISTKDFQRFVQELCNAKEHQYIDESGQTHTFKHNQITVIGTSIRSVDTKSPDHEFYRYGNDNASEVELTCEYIFNKKGYEDIMPESVKNTLNGLE